MSNKNEKNNTNELKDSNASITSVALNATNASVPNEKNVDVKQNKEATKATKDKTIGATKNASDSSNASQSTNVGDFSPFSTRTNGAKGDEAIQTETSLKPKPKDPNLNAFITKQDVIIARKHLIARNEIVNTRNLRRELGNRGSFTTINKYINEIVENEESQGDAFAMPQDCEDMSMNLAKEFWSKAISALDNKYQDLLHHQEDQIEQLKFENNSLCSTLDKYQTKSEQDDALIKQNNLELGKANGMVSTLTNENNHLRLMLSQLTGNLVTLNTEFVTKLTGNTNPNNLDASAIASNNNNPSNVQ